MGNSERQSTQTTITSTRGAHKGSPLAVQEYNKKGKNMSSKAILPALEFVCDSCGTNTTLPTAPRRPSDSELKTNSTILPDDWLGLHLWHKLPNDGGVDGRAPAQYKTRELHYCTDCAIRLMKSLQEGAFLQ